MNLYKYIRYYELYVGNLKQQTCFLVIEPGGFDVIGTKYLLGKPGHVILSTTNRKRGKFSLIPACSLPESDDKKEVTWTGVLPDSSGM